ncbi:MAG: DUF1460 domain-containing protein [Muribaculaceae bacterium]|nr:DUF1460 domain-containing protein [Muribaculaceae bacterium]MDE6754874.1 DUF1460 domain-containing protein [Muribaculaceae bacterium]
MTAFIHILSKQFKDLFCLSDAKKLILPVLFLCLCGSLKASGVRLHCKEDSVLVNRILAATAEHGGSFGERCLFAAKEMSGIKSGGRADNDTSGTLMVNLHTLDRLGFINAAMAFAETSTRKLPLFEEFVNNLEKYSRRKGIDEGFASQFFYGADWIVDNVYRGNLKEMTEYLPGGGFKVKTLDNISHHPELYPALKDSVTLDKIKMMEMGYRSHRIPHLKKQSISNKPLHELLEDGDIIMMLSNEIDTDLYDIGFVEMKDGMPYFVHFSPETGEIAEDAYPLPRLFKLENQRFYGYRWLRPTD